MRRDLLVLTTGLVLTAGVNAAAWSGVNGGVNGGVNSDIDLLWVGWGAPSGFVATPTLGLRAELLTSTALTQAATVDWLDMLRLGNGALDPLVASLIFASPL